jgi:hypothetical protein
MPELGTFFAALSKLLALRNMATIGHNAEKSKEE